MILITNKSHFIFFLKKNATIKTPSYIDPNIETIRDSIILKQSNKPTKWSLSKRTRDWTIQKPQTQRYYQITLLIILKWFELLLHRQTQHLIGLIWEIMQQTSVREADNQRTFKKKKLLEKVTLMPWSHENATDTNSVNREVTALSINPWKRL